MRAGAVRSHRAIPSDAAAGPAQTRMAWLLMDSVMTVLVLASTARYVINHGMNDLATLVLCGATALLAGYLARRALNPGLHPVWLAAVCLLWLVLVAIAPSFGWCVVVLAFAALRILAFRHAVVVVGVLIVGLIAATLRISDHFDPTVVAGPICLAVLAVATVPGPGQRGGATPATARRPVADAGRPGRRRADGRCVVRTSATVPRDP